MVGRVDCAQDLAKEADRFATLSLPLGLIFSILLTLTPPIVLAAAGIFGLVGHLAGVIHTHGL